MVLDPDEKPWTRNEVANYLGKSIWQVRQLEKDGSLKPFTDPNRVGRGGHPFSLHKPDDVRAYAAHELRKQRGTDLAAGEVSAEVFRAFARGTPLSEIVTTFQIDPERVKSLYHEYKRDDLEAGEAEEAARLQEKRNAQGIPTFESLSAMVGPKSLSTGEPQSLLAANRREAEFEARYPSYKRAPLNPFTEALRFFFAAVDADAVAEVMMIAAQHPKVRGFIDRIGQSLAKKAVQEGKQDDGQGDDQGSGETEGSPSSSPDSEGMGTSPICDKDG